MRYCLYAAAFAGAAKITLPVAATVPDFALTFSGALEKPATWTAEVQANVTTAARDDIPAAGVQLRASLKNLVATISELSVDSTGVAFRAKGGLPLGGLFSKADASTVANGSALEFEFTAADLSLVAKPVRGNVAGKGTAAVANGDLQIDATINADNLATDAATIAKSVTTLRAKMPMKPGASLRDIVAETETVATDLGAATARVDRVNVRTSLRALRAEVNELRIERGTSIITATAFMTLDEKGKPATPPEAKFAIEVPTLGDFQIEANGKQLNGAITGSGNITLADPVTASKGTVSIHGKGLKLGDAEGVSKDFLWGLVGIMPRQSEITA